VPLYAYKVGRRPFLIGWRVHGATRRGAALPEELLLACKYLIGDCGHSPFVWGAEIMFLQFFVAIFVRNPIVGVALSIIS